MLIPTLIAVFFVHWLGDFCFQTSWQAANKSKNWYALTYHVFTYSATLAAFGVIYCLAAWKIHSVLPWVLLNGGIHFGVDAVTSRMTAKLYKAGEIHNFFVVVGLDQFIHIVTLMLTLPLLTC